jgi:hypothetical protein
VHIGYTMWQDPKQNIMPKVTRIDLPKPASMGIAVEGSDSVWLSASSDPQLPDFVEGNPLRHYIDIFNRGQEPFTFTATAEQSWIVLSSSKGTVTKEERIWVSVDWTKAKGGIGFINISGGGGTSVRIIIPLIQTSFISSLQNGFMSVDNGGYVSIEAEHFTKNIPANQARWEKIEGYGRTLSAMSILPVTAQSATPPDNSPCLEYNMYLFIPGEAVVNAFFAPTLNFVPGRGLRYAVSFDNEKPQIIDILTKDFDARNGNREWEDSVRNASRTIRSTHNFSVSGYHTLKIWMVDPAVVLEKIVVDLGGLKTSYLGPPESLFKNPQIE